MQKTAISLKLDDVRIYDRALGAEEIQAIIDTEPEGLLAHWALDETSGRVAYDSAGTCDGALLGGPVWQPAGGMVGGALNLDGSNDCVLTDFVLNPADGPFSVFAWVKGGTPGEVIVSQDGSQDGADWLLADTGTFWSGLIDDVRIYDQPLSAEEVVALAR